MTCLYCGNKLRDNSNGDWHKSCIRRFFGTDRLPKIEIDEKTLEQLALESTHRGYTIPGVQKKLSLQLDSSQGKPRLTLVNYPTGFILKPQVSQFEALPQAEHLVMAMAAKSGISTVPNALIVDGEDLAYITKRIDRLYTPKGIQTLAMEDFCKLEGRLTQDKYKGSYERCARIISRYSMRRGLDMTEFFMRLVFSYIVGNSDMHLKNFSLIETAPGSADYILSPAYDLLPVNVVLPEDQEEMALSLNGKKSRIRLDDFLILADRIEIPRVSALAMIHKLLSMEENYIFMTGESRLPEKMKIALRDLIQDRVAILKS
ncbi:MAG: HipA domain-containing protein [Clostridiaceae bacterium]|nr:HipA domain-containing protein [Clostridiaceae bacterium]